MLYIVISLVISILFSTVIFIKWRRNVILLEKFKAIVDSVPESIFVIDKHKYITDIYHLLPDAMAGHSPNEIIGKRLTTFSEDKNSPFYQACSMLNKSFDRIVTTRETESFQYMINDAYLEVTIKLLHGGYVMSMVRDISHIVKRENDIKAKNQNEITVALSAGGVIPWNYDVKSKLFSSTAKNNVIEKITTYEELSEKITDEESKLILKDGFDSLISGESKHCEFTVQIRNNKGELQWNHVHAVPHEYDERGMVTTIIGSQKDVTNDIEAQNELIRLREKAEESNRLKTAFLANMSHEIRTPLNAIVGFSNLIVSSRDEEEVTQYVDIIEQNNELLLNIISDILDLSKIESGKLDFAMTTINITNLLENLEQMARLKVKNEVQIILDPLEEDIEIESDINRLSQIITNFLNNAIKFTTKGSIHLGCQRMEDAIYFYVQDTGKGIAAEHLSSIFGRFVKLDSFVQGTGLGLSICETIVNILGGEIGVDSELGKGAKFWFKIPYIKPSITIIARQMDEIYTTTSSSSMIEHKILIAEDNPSNYLLFEKVLSDYNTVHVWNGCEAVEFCKKELPTLIFMDIRMPKMDGYEATALIRELYTHVPIIAVTASVLQEEHAKAIACGFTDFIAKPINILKLREITAKYIN